MARKQKTEDGVEDNRATPHLDFTQLPINDAAETLRHLALHLIDALLGNERPQLDQWLTAGQARQLLAYRLHKLGTQKKLYAGNVVKRFGVRLLDGMWRLFGRERTYPYSTSNEQGVMGKLPVPVWEARVVHQWEKRAGLVSRQQLPDDMWQLISERAWGDVAFQHAIATRLQAYLRDKVLLTPGEVPVLQLHPHTYWLLLAWAGSQTKTVRWHNRLQPKRRVVRKAIKRLTARGSLYALTNNWAGLWDQWLLDEAAHVWGVAHIPRTVRSVVQRLAINRDDEQTAVSDEEALILDISREVGRDDRPIWFDALRQACAQLRIEAVPEKRSLRQRIGQKLTTTKMKMNSKMTRKARTQDGSTRRTV